MAYPLAVVRERHNRERHASAERPTRAARRVPGIRTSPTARSARRVRPVAVAARSDAGPNLPGALSVADLAAPVLKSHGKTVANEIALVSAKSAAVVAKDPAKDPAPTVAGLPVTHVAGGALAAAGAALALKNIFDRPSRAYVSGPEDGGLGTVGEEYDAWTEEGILEYYWGEHIHLGWYSDEDMAKGAGTLLGSNVKNFIEAKFDFVDKMLAGASARRSPRGCWTSAAASAAPRVTSPSVSDPTLRSRASPYPRTRSSAPPSSRKSRACQTRRFR